MRFLDTSSLDLVSSSECRSSEYALLSYTWSKTNDDSTYFDSYHLPSTSVACGKDQGWLLRQSSDSRRILQACDRARENGIPYLWVDSACIDHSSSAEVIESVICSFRLAWDTALCIVHLSDLSPIASKAPSLQELEAALSRCRWFTRLWTLQELVAPRRVEFFDREWNRVSTKDANSPREWLELLSRLSGVDISVLANRDTLFEISLGRRLSWAAHRQTTKSEDIAYVLAGICGVEGWLVPHPGEGGRRAFHRLQRNILQRTTDLSILAWKRPRESSVDLISGLLADSPADFSHFSSHPTWSMPFVSDTEMSFDDWGICVQGLLSYRQSDGDGEELLLLNATRSHFLGSTYVGIALKEVQPGMFVRSEPWAIESLSICEQDVKHRRIYVLDVTDDDFQRTLLPNDSRILEWVDAISSPSRHSCDQPPLMGMDVSMAEADTLESRADLDDDDIFLFDSVPEKVQLLDSAHELSCLIPHLVELGLQAWKSRRLRCLHPALTISQPCSYKHVLWQSSDDQSSSPKSEYTAWTVSSSPSLVEVRPLNIRAFRNPFACPYYRLFPNEHRTCFWSLSLTDIRSVVQHMIVDHRMPYFCPVCFITFPKAVDRDIHIVERSCASQEDAALPSGVSDDQVEQLDRAYRQWMASGVSEEEQWFGILTVLCPGTPRTYSPYLSESQERKLVLLRRFWCDEGHTLIANELERRGIIRFEGQSGGALEALHASVLKGMLEASGLVAPDLA